MAIRATDEREHIAGINNGAFANITLDGMAQDICIGAGPCTPGSGIQTFIFDCARCHGNAQ